MAEPPALNSLEQFLILAVARMDGTAYGVPIRKEIEERARRAVSMAAVYAGLDRLDGRGLLRYKLSPATPERGGRRRKLYSVTESGARAAHEARDALDRMWDGVDLEGRQSA